MQNNFNKTVFFIFFTIFCTFSALFFYVSKKIDENTLEIKSAETTWQNEVNRREDIRSLNDSVKKIDKERVDLNKHFANSSDIVPFLDTIESLAPLSNTKEEVTSVIVASDHSGLLVSLKASGAFSSLYKFIMLLENSPYEIEIESINIKRQTLAVDPTLKVASSPEWNLFLDIKLLSFIE